MWEEEYLPNVQIGHNCDWFVVCGSDLICVGRKDLLFELSFHFIFTFYSNPVGGFRQVSHGPLMLTDGKPAAVTTDGVE